MSFAGLRLYTVGRSSKNRATAVAGLFNVTAVGQRRSGGAINKAGHLVLQATREARAVKIYEAANVTHARFLAHLTKLDDFRTTLPEIFELRGRFVVAAWVHEARETVKPEALFQLLEKFHNFAGAEETQCGFDFWHDLILPRFLRAGELLGDFEWFEALGSYVSAFWDDLHPKVLMHPDLTPSNVLRGKDGHVYVIDNELVSKGSLPTFDVCSTANSLDQASRKRFLQSWYRRAALPSQGELEVARAAWLARLVGSAFVGGHIDKCSSLVELYRKREFRLAIE